MSPGGGIRQLPGHTVDLAPLGYSRSAGVLKISPLERQTSSRSSFGFFFGEHAFEFEFAAAGGTADDDRLHPMFSTWIRIPSVNIAARVSHIHVKSTSTTYDRIPWACHQAPRSWFYTPASLDVLFVRATVLLASAGRLAMVRVSLANLRESSMLTLDLGPWTLDLGPWRRCG